MGNFHCIPSTCARVVWREYLPPAIRYRYEGEDWQYVEGDDYTLDEGKGKCPILYDITFFFRYSNGYEETFTVREYGEIGRYFLVKEKLVKIEVGTKKDPTPGARIRNVRSTKKIKFVEYYITDITPSIPGQLDNCGECTLTIYKEGQEVFQIARDTCPEVEKLDCRLSDEVKEIKIDKEAYLQRIEVRNQSIDISYLTDILPTSPIEIPLIDINPLPEECLNIYNTFTTAPPLLSNYLPLPGVVNPYQFIQQICSAPGCPPPEYQVICDCDCEECPDGTCPVECGDHICCYDTSTGIAVQEIELKKYCDDDN